MMYGAVVLGASLGLTLLAREQRAQPAGEQAGPASRQLLEENKMILGVAAAAQAEAEHIRRSTNVDQTPVRKILDFSRNFTDRCHHAKQQRYYFPAVLVYAGPRVRGLIDELEAEHAYGQSVLDEIDYLLTSPDLATARMIAERLSTYADLVRRHVRKENEQLYQKADTALPDSEERALLVGFERLEQIELGPDFHERYHILGEEISEQRRRP
jgi:hemerythrin-like domain-containing protein